MTVDAKQFCSKGNKNYLIMNLNMSDGRNMDPSAPRMMHPLWKQLHEPFKLQDQREAQLSRFTRYISGNYR